MCAHNLHYHAQLHPNWSCTGTHSHKGHLKWKKMTYNTLADWGQNDLSLAFWPESTHHHAQVHPEWCGILPDSFLNWLSNTFKHGKHVYNDIGLSYLLCCRASALRLCDQLAFDTPTGSVHVWESGGGPVSVGQLTGGRVWWPLWELLSHNLNADTLQHNQMSGIFSQGQYQPNVVGHGTASI